MIGTSDSLHSEIHDSTFLNFSKTVSSSERRTSKLIDFKHFKKDDQSILNDNRTYSGVNEMHSIISKKTKNNMDLISDVRSFNINKYRSSKVNRLKILPLYKVLLDFNKQDIENLRKCWNQMISEKSYESRNAIPGSYLEESDVSQNFLSFSSTSSTKQKILHTINNINSIRFKGSTLCCEFYNNMIRLDPNLIKMFPSIKHQAVAFATVLSFTINQLEDLKNVENYLMSIAKKHSRILGIKPYMFELMGKALLQTFSERFGVNYFEKYEHLWIELYLYLSNTLIYYGIDPVLDYVSIDSVPNFLDTSFFKKSLKKKVSNINSTIKSESIRKNSFNLNSGNDRDFSNKKLSNFININPKNQKNKEKKNDCAIH